MTPPRIASAVGRLHGGPPDKTSCRGTLFCHPRIHGSDKMLPHKRVGEGSCNGNLEAAWIRARTYRTPDTRVPTTNNGISKEAVEGFATPNWQCAGSIPSPLARAEFPAGLGVDHCAGKTAPRCRVESGWGVTPQ